MPHKIDAEMSIAFRLGSEPERVAETIALRYIGNHPKVPFTFRAFSRRGFRQLSDGRFDLNLDEKHPEAAIGQWAYVLGRIWSDQESHWETAISCYGPTRLHVNDRPVYRSEAAEEVNSQVRRAVRIPLQPGWNSLLFAFCKTASGFGGAVGTVRSKWGTPTVQAPFAERFGEAGWAYSELANAEWANSELPYSELACSESALAWFPERQWSEEERERGVGSRLFGDGNPGRYAYGWSRVRCAGHGRVRYRLRLVAHGPAAVWVDGEELLSASEAGITERDVELAFGSRDVLVRFAPGADDWGYTLELAHVSAGGEALCEFELPQPIRGTDECWLYLGPFAEGSRYSRKEVQTLYGLWEEKEGGIYWRLDEPDVWVRPYAENTNFARWSYPLGVTLYGLLRTGRALKRPDMERYAFDHIGFCTRMYAYSLWEKRQYGYPSVNHQLAELDMLDDCGSFASAMLEAYRDCPEPSSLRVAEAVADFMMNRQERKEDGVFYRACPGYYMENTLWGDDLYMSVPFLIRYARLTGEDVYLDEAAKQALLFREYLYMPELRILSHVYDFKYGTATKVPWGRGNGWPVFTLSELLEALPTAHPDRERLLLFFRELCGGLLKLQGKNGLWHQVLNDPDSYEETSCTAMFVYAFCRGLRLGFLDDLDDSEAYVQAVRRGWEGLTCHAVDQWGNVHGVCVGSRYSFSPSYYKDDLPWTVNDTHGIGIVMLAGMEYAALLERLESSRL
ncbi:glycoside hydrolase family 88/105 protein [Cohnella fermenti]|uniref:Glycosyl hydrolase n=1 Tax=Cohnella fermenti TaxID=2565925 RepID=A0A4S4BF56_9BACL|nr:glycoside hydrolase family 88 protein [Cohnella fermenti]THF72900.1 glycosyl hydrolase [Cohnella fermenti]